MFSRCSVQEKTASATQASREMGSASLGRVGRGLGFFGSGCCLCGMRCGPPDSIARDINMAAESLRGVHWGPTEDREPVVNFDGQVSILHPSHLVNILRETERQTERQRSRKRQRQRWRKSERGRQRETPRVRPVICRLGHASGLQRTSEASMFAHPVDMS